ncbi:MAG TPA: hypothetical protein H9909_00070 [Candidatus Mediterraneibacter norfolkensis]|nr:hypothetical protein [Candidatus Mediterraneibacter norfolkensis]
MRDIRILTLYKQYYLDSYPVPLKCQYTTWGYYDGINITKSENGINCSTLFKKKSQAPISQIWYDTGAIIGKLEGKYGNQNIGMFRCVSEQEKKRIEQTKEFWRIQNKMPFIAIGFLQLNKCDDYEKISRKIEAKGDEHEKRLTDECCFILTYCTYDNADLIVLLQANSIIKLESTLQEIEGMPDVEYMHSIMGVSEVYLGECSQKSEILDVWNQTNCFVEQSIKRLSIHLVTSGNAKILAELKATLDKSDSEWGLKGYDKAVYSYVSGHENICITLHETDVKSLMALLVPRGFATHQNGVYGRGVYNIETSFAVKEEIWRDVEGLDLPESDPGEKTSMCRELLKQYGERLEMIKKEDESLYSYYQALMQTVNTLDQYENFGLSKNIFWLLFPALDLFNELLDRAIENEERNYYDQIESIKLSIKRFLDSVNSVLYHTIHTDQIFLMVPGYSGTSFSIPIKLNLMYLWFIGKVTDVLNDSSHKYCCILAPEIESRPITNIISFGLPERDRLILVRLSQRSLFLPRDLMIILNHEIAHYVSEQVRNRAARLEGITITLAYFIAEYIFPESYSPNALTEMEKNIFCKLKKSIKGTLQTDALRFILNYNQSQFGGKKEIYASGLAEKLYDAVWNYIGPTEKRAHQVIFCLPESIRKEIEKNDEDFIRLMKFTYRIQGYLDGNRRKMQGDRKVRQAIERLIKIYREIFSDVAAMVILGIDENDFREAFKISEGREISEENRPEEQMLREKVIHFLLNKLPPDRRIFSTSCHSEKEEDLPDAEHGRVVEDLFRYGWMQRELLIYAESVCKGMNERVKKSECQKDVQALKEMFNLFKGKPDLECSEIYSHINNSISEYVAKQEKEHQRWKEKNCTKL